MLTQSLVPPVARLAEAARALAPFPLPVFPIKVSQFWAFNPGTGDRPTIPVVALQLYAAEAHARLLQALGGPQPAQATVRSGPVETIRWLRTRFRQEPSLTERVPGAVSVDSLSVGQHQRLRSLIEMYAGPDSYYLDFYGPPQTFTTVPYAGVLDAPGTGPAAQTAPDLQGKAVFIGYSERLHPEQLDKFYTVFSQPNGLNLSGVEISATAFANLLENRHVTPLPMPAQLLLLFGWGLLAGLLLRWLPVFPAVVTGVGLGVVYLGIACVLFSDSAIWLPLIAPLLIQLPAALFSAILWHYLDVRQERESIRTAFGFYLPPAVVDRLAHDLADGRTDSQVMHGTCLSTDARQYTTLSEEMDLEALGKLMNAYYETLFKPVRKQHGIVSDVVGDSMLAIWAAGSPDPAIRRAALQAALDIDRSVNTTGPGKAPHHLPTRIGLHSGRILLGSIGAMDHFEYRAVGDIVNTCSRVQGLNKYLGTRVLLTREVLAGINDFETREIGTFVLAGKARPLVIHELLGRHQPGVAHRPSGEQAAFAAGLAAFRSGDLGRARQVFTPLANDSDDSVARYYLALCDHHRRPGPDWDGVIRMDTK
jgi:adenylate cyclase